MRKIYKLLFVALIIAFICTAGCNNKKTDPKITTTSPSITPTPFKMILITTSPTAPLIINGIQQPTPIRTIIPKITVVPPSGFHKFTSEVVRFTIYLPDNGWEGYAKNSKIPFDYNNIVEDMSSDTIHIYDSKATTSNYSFTIYGSRFKSNPPLYDLTNKFAATSVNDLKYRDNTEVLLQTSRNQLHFSDYDSISYIITYNTPDKMPSTQQVTIIKHGITYYIITFYATNNVYNNEINIVNRIISTLEPTY